MVSSPQRAPAASLVESRLVVVSGKGGVGKTTVAAALARGAADEGKRVLIVEVEQREGIAPLFGRESLNYNERELAPNINGLSVVPDEALVEYLYLFYGIGKLARPLLTGKAVDFATNTAPGLRDILLIGKVKEAESRRAGGAYVYDLIVLDAPPTGRLPRFLDAPRAVVDLVKTGAIRQQAQGVLDMLEDPKRTSVVLVTLAEEMPVRETIEGATHLRAMSIALGPVVVNAVLDRPFTAPQIDALCGEPDRAAEALLADAAAAGITLNDEQVRVVAEVASAHARRSELQSAAVATLANELDLPRFTLPSMLTPQIGPDEIAALAHILRDQGAV